MPRAKVDNPETKARIIEAAEALFAERGIDGVAVREVAARAEVNTALVHYYFGTKEKLYREVLFAVAADLAAMAAEIAAMPGPAPERIRAYVHGLARIVVLRPNHPRLIFRELLNGAPIARAAFAAGFQPVHIAVLRGVLDEGIRAGELRAVDAALMPLMVIGMVAQFAIARPLIGVAVGPVDYDEAFAGRVAGQVADVLLNGVLAHRHSLDTEESS